MEVEQKDFDRAMNELAPNAYRESVLVPKMEAIAELKGLEVFIFRDDGLKKYFSNVSSEIGIVLMARDEENAKWNLQNFRKCYLIKLETKY